MKRRKDEGHKIVGYARKSAGAEEKEAAQLHARSRRKSLCVSASCQASKPIARRDRGTPSTASSVEGANGTAAGNTIVQLYSYYLTCSVRHDEISANHPKQSPPRGDRLAPV